ncbi:MAG: hypothetical protein NXI21_01750 [Alphaproteobacteria bacterium]|nr:hypothetical protein [Alphaproteobacteria bacterium]
MAKFILAEEPRFTWPVEIRVPTESGTFQTQAIRAQFRVLPQSRLEEIARARVDDQDTNRSMIHEALIGWEARDVVDEDGAEIPFSEGVKDQLLDIPYVLIAMAKAYRDAVITGEKSKLGN